MKYRIVNPNSRIDKVQLEYICPACRTKLKNPITEAGTKDVCPECDATFIVPGESDLKWYQNKEIVDKLNDTKNSSKPIPVVKEKEPKRKIYGEDRTVVLGPAYLVQAIVDSIRGFLSGLVKPRFTKQVESGAHGLLLLGLVFIAILGPLISKHEESVQLWAVSAVFIVSIVIAQFIAWKALNANRNLIKNSPSSLQNSFVLDVFGVYIFIVGIGYLMFEASSANAFEIISAAIISFAFFAGAAICFNPSIANVTKSETDAGEEIIGLYAFSLKFYAVIAPFVYLSASLLACVIAVKGLYYFSQGEINSYQVQLIWYKSCYILLIGAIYPFVAYIMLLSFYLVVSIIKKFFDLVEHKVK